MKSWVSLLCVFLLTALLQAAAVAADKLEFQKGERIAFVGGSLAERMNLYGHFEALLQSRFRKRAGCPQLRPARRRSRAAAAANDYTKLDDPLEVFGPDTFLCFFGYNESFAGPAGIEKFKGGYEKFMAEYATKYGRNGKARFVLVSPMAFEQPSDRCCPMAKRRMKT
jgi:hypothetical protein